MWRLYVGIAIAVGTLALGVYVRHVIIENHELKQELKTANATVGALDEVNRRNNELYQQERDAVDEIENAPPSDDGPVAPVLMRTLNDIDRVRGNTSR